MEIIRVSGYDFAGKNYYDWKAVMQEEVEMSEHLIRILYETSPEKIERLSKRLMPVAESMEKKESGDKLYLEVVVRDDFFDVCLRKKKERMPSVTIDKESGEGITVASAYRYLCSHSMDEFSDYTGLSKSTCYRRIAYFKQGGMWDMDTDLLYF